VADVLEPGGTLEVATDWDDYADHVRTMVTAEPRLEQDLDAGRPDRPVTAYERRGLAAGRRVTDLRFHRITDQG
jgi:tRNA (guanine-N7-)-methyltransferase